jgi:hypothetical protein
MLDAPQSLYGMKIVCHPLAVEIRHEVQRHPIKKRRRNWRVVKVQRPGCYQAGNTFYMHPEIYAKLKEHGHA